MATDRTVLVRLKANVGDFVAGMSTARAAVRGFTKDIDTSNDRVAWLTQGILALAPALVPLGEAAVPILAGLAAQMTVAAGAAGTLALGLHGIGDALKAVDAYQLEPTVQNLQKMKLELEKIGPAGAEFVRFLDSIEPELQSLQDTAREGMLPGFEEGLKELLTELPAARNLIGEFATGLGQLAEEAGKGLTGDGFTEFFDYLQKDAKPLLIDMGRTIGNFIQGIANMMVAFEPLTDQFSNGLLEMSRSFADWADNLEDNDSFQGFLRAVEEAIPRALAFGEALTDAFVAIVGAAAPVGAVMLPALTKLLDVIALIADSPIGPIFVGAAAAMSLYGRAVAIANVTTGGLGGKMVGLVKPTLAASGGVRTLAADLRILSASATKVQAPVAGFIGPLTKGQAAMERMRVTASGLGKTAGLVAGFALATSGAAESTGLSNTASLALMGTIAGPWGAAIGGAIGLTMDLAAANNDLGDAVTNANLAMASNDIELMKQRYKELGDEVDETADKTNPNRFLPGGEGIQGFGDAFDTLGSYWSKFTGETDDAKDTLDDLGDAIGHSIDDVGLFGIGVLSASNRVKALSAALSDLQGWFDKRAAIRAYNESVRELAKGIKDGFGKKDIENLDAVGNNILKVANSIKDPALRHDFMENAVTSLQALADHSGPKAAAAIQRVIDKFGELGLAHPVVKVDADTQRAEDAFERSRRDAANLNDTKVKPTIEADDSPFRATYGSVKAAMAQADRLRAHPELHVETGDSLPLIARIAAMINGLHSKTISLRVERSVHGPSAGGGYPGEPAADGAMVPKTGLPYADRHLYLLADGEQIISNRRGQADRFRKDMAMGRIPRYADGGTTDWHQVRPPQWHQVQNQANNMAFDTSWIQDLISGFHDVAGTLALLNRALKKAEAAVERDKAARDAVAAAMESLSQSVQDQLRSDIFAEPTNVWSSQANMSATDILNADTAEAEQFTALIESLSAKGLTGAALAEVASGGVDRLRAYDSMSAVDLAAYAAAYQRREKALQVAGTTTGQAAYGGDYAVLDKAFRDELAELREIKRAINLMNREQKQAHDKAADKITDGVNGAGHKGKRNRVYAAG